MATTYPEAVRTLADKHNIDDTNAAATIGWALAQAITRDAVVAHILDPVLGAAEYLSDPRADAIAYDAKQIIAAYGDVANVPVDYLSSLDNAFGLGASTPDDYRDMYYQLVTH